MFAGWHEPVAKLLAATPPDQLLHHQLADLDPVPPMRFGDRVALVGDAAHAMTPNLGQGAAQALEDAVTLVAEVGGGDIAAGLARYDAARRPRAVSLVRNSRRVGQVIGAERTGDVRAARPGASRHPRPGGAGKRRPHRELAPPIEQRRARRRHPGLNFGSLVAMGVILRAAAVTDLGLVRSNNEDSAHVGPRLLAIADGMGGLPAGELASDVVIKALAPLDDADTDADPLQLLTAAVEDGNNRVADMVDEDPDREGMGTTVTALLLSDDRLGLVHVGDSRCYLLHDGALEQITRDDTLVQSLVDRGALTPAQARVAPAALAGDPGRAGPADDDLRRHPRTARRRPVPAVQRRALRRRHRRGDRAGARPPTPSRRSAPSSW